MRKLICICLLACGIFFLAGCGNSVPEGNAISVDKKGTITSTITESFDKDFYDADELKEEIDSELADYNKTFAKDHISLKKFEVKNDFPENVPGEISDIEWDSKGFSTCIKSSVSAPFLKNSCKYRRFFHKN